MSIHVNGRLISWSYLLVELSEEEEEKALSFCGEREEVIVRSFI